MRKTAAYETARGAEFQFTLAVPDTGFRLRRPRGARAGRLVLLMAGALVLAAGLGSVTVSAQTPRVQQAAAQITEQAASAEAPRQRRVVRVIQIYNLPAR